VAAKVDQMETQLANLRARLQIFEARQVPYTTEELGLFRSSAPKLARAEPAPTRKSVKELPVGTANLVAEAQRFFSNRQFDKAEEKYLEVLRKDQNNVYTLANLAAIELERNDLDQAEKHIKQAISEAPDDAYSLSILGYLKFRQEKYDDAFDALSHAAQLNPDSAEIQNFLGLTLSHKGMRLPAETALRKAIQLEPGYGSAHNNLAVIYITQQPAQVELARWHYQKALAAGHPHNPDLEKMLEDKKTADNRP
jgi:Flp pilus assembly protein TadD